MVSHADLDRTRGLSSTKLRWNASVPLLLLEPHLTPSSDACLASDALDRCLSGLLRPRSITACRLFRR